MKILLIHSKNDKIAALAKAIKRGAEEKGHQVTILDPSKQGEVLSCHVYQLLIVGSPVLGLFGGKIAEDLRPLLSALKGTEGQPSIAFTDHKVFGTDKALRHLMGLMESQGCIVKDFRDFHSIEEAYTFGGQI